MQPYQPQALPLKSPDWASLVHLIGPANAELARYDGILQTMVNPAVLLSPLTTQEAVLSSRIEGTQATLQEVLEYEAEEGRKTEKVDDIREILNYRRAMQSAVDTLNNKPIHLNLMKEIQSVLLDSVRGANRARGQFRSIQNWIGRPGCTIEEATYIPPAPHEIDQHMSNLEHYIHYGEQDRLVQLAVIHAQFEMIHPFIDGNGRVGRILIPLFLFEKKLLSSPMFYLSSYLEAHREEYYAKLQGISQNNEWARWIDFFLTAIIEQAKLNCQKAKMILELYNQMKTKIADLTRSRFSIHVTDTIFCQPLFSSTQFTRVSKIPKSSVTRLLSILEDNQIVVRIRERQGKRPAYYSFPELLRITES